MTCRDSLPLSSALAEMIQPPSSSFFFFFNDTATTEIYTLSLHDALPISWPIPAAGTAGQRTDGTDGARHAGDRKSTRLNSSHSQISYAVFCLKKKKKCEKLSSTRTIASTQSLSGSSTVRCQSRTSLAVCT